MSQEDQKIMLTQDWVDAMVEISHLSPEDKTPEKILAHLKLDKDFKYIHSVLLKYSGSQWKWFLKEKVI